MLSSVYTIKHIYIIYIFLVKHVSLILMELVYFLSLKHIISTISFVVYYYFCSYDNFYHVFFLLQITKNYCNNDLNKVFLLIVSFDFLN